MTRYRRGRRRLLIELLRILNGEKDGLRITRLTSKINSYWVFIHPFLDELISLDLIEKRPYKKACKIFITKKGMEVNHHFFVSDSIERSFGLTKLDFYDY